MLAYLFLCASWLIGVLAMPSFEGVTSWSSIGSLVPGMTALEALGPSASGHASDEPGQSPFYFSIDAPHGASPHAQVRRPWLTARRPDGERDGQEGPRAALVLHPRRAALQLSQRVDDISRASRERDARGGHAAADRRRHAARRRRARRDLAVAGDTALLRARHGEQRRRVLRLPECGRPHGAVLVLARVAHSSGLYPVHGAQLHASRVVRRQ